MKTNALRRILPGIAALLVTISTVHAQEDIPARWHAYGLGHALGASLLFGLVGILLAIAGFKLFDLATPFNLEKEMCENKNVAVGILCGAIVLGICHIIAASMS